MTRLLIFGSGTALPDADRSNSGYCWEGPEGLLLLDCGGVPYQNLLRSGLDPLQTRAIFLSHSHPDHIAGLPLFLFHLWLARYQGQLLVLGNQHTIDLARSYTQALGAEEHLIQPEWRILPDDGGSVELPFDTGGLVRTAPVIHSRPTLAIRLEDRASGRALVYGADADYSERLVELARGAHILLHECSVSQPFKNHSTPEQAAEVALKAGVQRLVIIHYSPAYTAPEAEIIERIRRAGFAGEVAIGRDGEEYRLDG